MKETFSDMLRHIKTISYFDVIDILCVTVLFYFVYKFMRERRSGKLAAGVVVLLLLYFVSEFLNMYVLQFLLKNVFQLGVIVLAIIFQPELRSALEKVGGQPFRGFKSIGETKNQPTEQMISIVSEAVVDLSRSKTGALIVIERETKLGDLILTGTVVNSDPSVFLIKNIFYDKAPLHDGALIIREGRLHAAGCLLPLSSNKDIAKDLGTRHHAAIGMSENSDAVVVVVSEETGIISLAFEGVLYRGHDRMSLERELRHYLIGDNDKHTGVIQLRKVKRKKQNTEKVEK